MRISHIIAVALTILLTNGALWIRFRVKTDHLQVRMSDLQTQALESKRFIDNFCSSVTLIGRKLDAILESRPGDFERILSAEEPRQLVLVFSKENCMACVMSQLRVFSKIQELAADRKSIRVIGITDGPRAWINRLIRIFGQRFPIYSDVNFSASLPDNILPLGHPDRQKTVHPCRLSTHPREESLLPGILWDYTRQIGSAFPSF